MEIIKKTKEIKQLLYKIKKRKLKKIDWIVVHGTGDPEGSKENRTLRYVLSEDGLCTVSRGKILFHYFINKKGEIFQFLQLDEWACHSNLGRGDKRTIGIELENISVSKEIKEINDNYFTSEQYSSLDFLIQKLDEELKIKYCSTHDYCRYLAKKPPKHCAGKNFNFFSYCSPDYPNIQFFEWDYQKNVITKY